MLAKSPVSMASPTAPFQAKPPASLRPARPPLPVRQRPERPCRVEASAAHWGRIEYHFHASARVHPGESKSWSSAGGRGVRLSDLSIALRLFDGDRRLLGSLGTGREEVAYPAPMPQRYRPPLAARLLRGGALLCFDRGGRRLDMAAGQGASVDVVLDRALLEQLPMTVLTRLVRLGRFHFCRSFKRSFGVLPRGYRICLRAKNPDVSASLPEPPAGLDVPLELVVTGMIGS